MNYKKRHSGHGGYSEPALYADDQPRRRRPKSFSTWRMVIVLGLVAVGVLLLTYYLSHAINAA